MLPGDETGGETMAGRLAGKVALISGTAGGQGRRAAIHFAAEGAKIVGCDVKEVEAKETVEMVRGRPAARWCRSSPSTSPRRTR